jgi:hypothetical protein
MTARAFEKESGTISKLICRLFGHSKKAQVSAVFFRSWNGMYEVGSLHCARCGKMLGEYKRNMTEPIR